MNYRNPVLPGFHPDPSVCRVGGDFYLATSSFEYFPGVPLFHSTDLVHWRAIGHALTRDSQLPLAGAGVSGGIYAPTLRHHRGRFYLTTTNVTRGGNFYVTAEDPAGPWSEPVWVDQPGIDPDLFWDVDGTCYYTTNGCRQSVIDIESGRRLGDIQPTWSGTGGQCPEAPHLFRIGGAYYFLLAEGGTEYGHMVTIARSNSPTGPWEPCPTNPILSHRSRGTRIHATGHADLVEDARGNWWMLCLGIRPVGYPPAHHLGRETFLAPVLWKNGWPVIGNEGTIALEMSGPDLPPGVAPGLVERDDFRGPELVPFWNFRCNPAPGSWSLHEEPGSLVLACTPASLDDMCGQAWIGRRQQHFQVRASAGLTFLPGSDREEAGICVFQNIHHHYEVGLTLRGGAPRVVVRRRIGSLTAEVADAAVPEGRLTLVIDTDGREYRLGFLDGGGEPVFLAAGEARYLATEVAGGFTGVYLAMYATSFGRPASNRARFHFFHYQVQTS